MKKNKLLLAVMCLSLVISCVIGIAACNPSEHEHEYSEVWSYDDESHYHACTVGGGTCESVKDSAAHNLGEWQIETPASADAKGKEKRECSVCGYVLYRDIDKLSPSVPAHQHDWDVWKVAQDGIPSANAAGKAVRFCKGSGECNAAESDKTCVLPALSDEAYEVGRDTATCMSGGHIEYKYKIGEQSLVIRVETAVNPDAHDWGGYVNNDKAGHCKVCSLNGEHKTELEPHNESGDNGSCSVCGYEKEHEHVWSAWIVESGHEPTEQAVGKAIRSCSGAGVCDAEDADKNYELPALDDESYQVGNDTATCSAAGRIEYKYLIGQQAVSIYVQTPIKVDAHDWGGYVNNDKAGHYKVCGINGEHRTAVEPHDESGDNGNCSVCGYAKEHEHVWSAWVVESGNEPSEQAVGIAVRSCSGAGECNADISDKEYELPVLSSELYVKSVNDATCSEDGEALYSYNHNQVEVSFSLIIPAKGHGELAHHQAEPASCTENGSVEYWSCPNCPLLWSDAQGENVIEDIVVPAGHSYVHHDAVASTCVDGGIEYWSCSNCSLLWSDGEHSVQISEDDVAVAATDKHTYSYPASYHASVAATCTTDGMKIYYECTVCHTKFTENFQYNANAEPIADESELVVPATGHKLTHYPYKDSTCAAAGNTEYWYCTNSCRKYYSDEAAENEIKSVDKVIAKKPHGEMSHTAAVAATCTQKGNIEYWTCSVCKYNYGDEAGTIRKTSVETAALGHVCEYTVVNVPSNDAGGLATKACTRCDYTGEQSLMSLGTSGVYKVSNESKATCFEDGSATYEVAYADGKCVFTVDFPALAHANSQPIAKGQGTEENKGAISVTNRYGSVITLKNAGSYYYCPDCQNIYSDSDCIQQVEMHYYNRALGVLLSYGENDIEVCSLNMASYQALVSGEYTFELNQNFTRIQYMADNDKPQNVFTSSDWVADESASQLVGLFDKGASVGNKIVVSMTAGDIITVTGASKFANISISCDVKQLIYGQNSVEITQSNAAIGASEDIYYLGSSVDKVYSITIPKGVIVEIGENGHVLEAIGELEDGETVSQNIEVKAHTPVKLTFAANAVGLYNVVIGEAVWELPSLKVTPAGSSDVNLDITMQWLTPTAFKLEGVEVGKKYRISFSGAFVTSRLQGAGSWYVRLDNSADVTFDKIKDNSGKGDGNTMYFAANSNPRGSTTNNGVRYVAGMGANIYIEFTATGDEVFWLASATTSVSGGSTTAGADITDISMVLKEVG